MSDSVSPSSSRGPKLLAGERIPERPFTDPEHSVQDLEHLTYMLHQVREAVETGVLFDQLEETGSKGHVIRVYDANTLRQSKAFHFVGFRGFKREQPDLSLIEQVQGADKRLSGELSGHTVLAYSSLELENNNWINLVLLRFGDDKTRFHGNPTHQYAARELAPQLYRHIRLHSGSLNGLYGEVRLERTQYHDFGEDDPWFALRVYDSAVSRPIHDVAEPSVLIERA